MSFAINKAKQLANKFTQQYIVPTDSACHCTIFLAVNTFYTAFDLPQLCHTKFRLKICKASKNTIRFLHVSGLNKPYIKNTMVYVKVSH